MNKHTTKIKSNILAEKAPPSMAGLKKFAADFFDPLYISQEEFEEGERIKQAEKKAKEEALQKAREQGPTIGAIDPKDAAKAYAKYLSDVQRQGETTGRIPGSAVGAGAETVPYGDRSFGEKISGSGQAGDWKSELDKKALKAYQDALTAGVPESDLSFYKYSTPNVASTLSGAAYDVLALGTGMNRIPGQRTPYTFDPKTGTLNLPTTISRARQTSAVRARDKSEQILGTKELYTMPYSSAPQLPTAGQKQEPTKITTSQPETAKTDRGIYGKATGTSGLGVTDIFKSMQRKGLEGALAVAMTSPAAAVATSSPLVKPPVPIVARDTQQPTGVSNLNTRTGASEPIKYAGSGVRQVGSEVRDIATGAHLNVAPNARQLQMAQLPKPAAKPTTASLMSTIRDIATGAHLNVAPDAKQLQMAQQQTQATPTSQSAQAAPQVTPPQNAPQAAPQVAPQSASTQQAASTIAPAKQAAATVASAQQVAPAKQAASTQQATQQAASAQQVAPTIAPAQVAAATVAAAAAATQSQNQGSNAPRTRRPGRTSRGRTSPTVNPGGDVDAVEYVPAAPAPKPTDYSSDPFTIKIKSNIMQGFNAGEDGRAASSGNILDPMDTYLTKLALGSRGPSRNPIFDVGR